MTQVRIISENAKTTLGPTTVNLKALKGLFCSYSCHAKPSRLPQFPFEPSNEALSSAPQYSTLCSARTKVLEMTLRSFLIPFQVSPRNARPKLICS